MPEYRAQLTEIISAIDATIGDRQKQDQAVLRAARDAYEVALRMARRLEPREPTRDGDDGTAQIIPFPQR